ncbi:MAG: C45 family peptidase [Planctomycetes bacterium]|nr:C45 family peptidase [Planctomycetota bacterium]
MASSPNPEMVGGVPLISVIGTPRTIGETIGSRLRSRLQVLSQYLMEQLASSARAGGVRLTPADLRKHLRQNILPAAQHEPALWMEMESMARAAELAEEDLLLIHGYGDLLSYFSCPVPPMASSFACLAPHHSCDSRPWLVHAWHLDPALFPYITLVRRIPSHGPASLCLTLAGLHPVAGVSEAGLAACSNELRVTDGATGHFTSHLLASALTAPAFDDALRRLQSGPRQGGAALHLISHLQRATVELCGQQAVRLPDPQPRSPRVHTNHPLNDEVLRWAAPVGDPTSHVRLNHLARQAVDAIALPPLQVAAWFGLGRDGSSGSGIGAQQPQVEGMPPETTVLTLLDPVGKGLHIRRGGSPAALELITL